MFGAFWQGKVPSIPENFEPGSETAYDIESKDGDFCFCYLPAQGCHYHYTSAEEYPLAVIEKEYEGGVNLSIANGFMIIGYSSGSDSCFGETSDLKEVTVAGISSPSKACAVPEEL